MRVETSIEIDAPPAVVWAILIDFAAYPEWNPMTVAVEGEPRVDEVVKLTVKLGGQEMHRKHVISRVEEATALCWTIRTRKPWLMRGERCQRIVDLGDGRCRYENDERVEGLSSVVVAATYQGKIRAGLEALSESLKARAEARV